MTDKKELTEEEKASLTQLRDDMLKEMRRNDAMVRAIRKATFEKREKEKNEE